MPRSAPGPSMRRPSSSTSPAVWVVQAGDDAQQRALAAAAGAEDGDEVVLGHARGRWPAAPAVPWSKRSCASAADRRGCGPMLIGPAGPTETGAVERLEPRSLTSPIRPITMMPKMIWSVASSAWLSVIMWPMPLGRPDQLGHDHIGPGPAEHHAQGLGDLGRRAGDQHAPDQAGVAAAQRVGRLDQVAPRVAHGHRDHQHELEEAADEDHRQLLRLADAGPQDQQRDEGAGRQVAREADEGLEEGLDRLVGAHRHAQRHGRARRR